MSRFVFLPTLLVFSMFCLPAIAEEQTDSIRFVVLGDTRGSGGEAVNAAVMEDLFSAILELDPSAWFVLVTGDLIYGSRDGEIARSQFAEWLNAFLKASLNC